MNKKISIVIVEDYLLARITCKKALEKYDDIEIKGDFDSAEGCLELLEHDSVDVVLMDIGLPYMTGIEATKIIKEKYPNIKIIMLTSHDNEDEILSSLSSGANAYALKEAISQDIEAINFVINFVSGASIRKFVNIIVTQATIVPIALM